MKSMREGNETSNLVKSTAGMIKDSTMSCHAGPLFSLNSQSFAQAVMLVVQGFAAHSEQRKR